MNGQDKKFFKIIALTAAFVLFGAGCTVKSPSPAVSSVTENVNTKAAAPVPISDNTLNNMSYPLGGDFFGLDSVDLKDGYADVNTDSSSGGFAKLDKTIGRGDVNQDGAEDAVVVLWVNQGGTGTWPIVYVVLNEEGKAVPYKSAGFEDRAAIHGIAIKDGVVTFDLTVHADSDPSCCPTLHKTESYQWFSEFGNGLQFQQINDHVPGYSEYVELTTKIEHFSGMDHAPDETDVYRGGTLVLEIQPQYPKGYSAGASQGSVPWNIYLTPVIGGNPKTVSKEKIISVNSVNVPDIKLLDDFNKMHPNQIWMKIGDADVMYDMYDKTVTADDGTPKD